MSALSRAAAREDLKRVGWFGFTDLVDFTELVEYDPADVDTYPSVCQAPEEVAQRFGFTGGETLLFDRFRGRYLGQVVKQLGS